MSFLNRNILFGKIFQDIDPIALTFFEKRNKNLF